MIVAVSRDRQQVDHPIDDGHQVRTEVWETLGESPHDTVLETRIVDEDRASRASVVYQGAGEGLAGVLAGKVEELLVHYFSTR